MMNELKNKRNNPQKLEGTKFRINLSPEKGNEKILKYNLINIIIAKVVNSTET